MRLPNKIEKVVQVAKALVAHRKLDNDVERTARKLGISYNKPSLLSRLQLVRQAQRKG